MRCQVYFARNDGSGGITGKARIGDAVERVDRQAERGSRTLGHRSGKQNGPDIVTELHPQKLCLGLELRMH